MTKFFSIRYLERDRQMFRLRQSGWRSCSHHLTVSLGKVVESANNKMRNVIMTPTKQGVFLKIKKLEKMTDIAHTLERSPFRLETA